MLAALAVICCAPTAICSIRAVMSSTAWPIVKNASRVCSTTAAPSWLRLAPSCTTPTALPVSSLDRADQLRDLLRGVLLVGFGPRAALRGGVGERCAQPGWGACQVVILNWDISRSSVSALPESSCAEAAICSAEAEVCSVEAETSSVDVEDCSATAATSSMFSCML